MVRFLIVGAVLLMGSSAAAQVIDPYYADDYTLVDLGAPPGVPTPYGGVTFLAGDPDTMLIGGDANGASAAIYSIGVERGCTGRIVGFVGTAEFYASAPEIDGGLTYGPGGVLFYSGYSENLLGQIKPGSTAPDRVVELGPLGVDSSVGAMQIVPSGFAGAGRLKLAPFNTSNWFDAELVPDGNGTYDVANVTLVNNVGGGPEGIVYISGQNPLFDADSVIVAEYTFGSTAAYEIDANGDAVLSTRRDLVTGLGGAEGATVDPDKGDFVFSTFGGGDRVIAVRGFQDPCRGDLDDDNDVNVLDLLDMLARWGNSCDPADLDESESVDVLDLLILLANWGPC